MLHTKWQFLRFLAFGVYGISVSIIVEFWANIYITDVDVPMNASQPHHLFIMTEYFVDQEKYFYLILLHINAVFFIGITIMLAIGTMFITYLQCTCGMFKIAR